MTKRIYAIALLGAGSALLGCSAAGAGDELEEFETLDQGVRKGQPGAVNGQGDYCHATNPCVAGEGDCDTNSECAPTLVCGTDNGAHFGLRSLIDTCVAAHCTNGTQDGGQGETGVDCGGECGSCTGTGTPGNGTFCSVGIPCASGEGDCDSDAECQAGLTCGSANGHHFGFGQATDVCVPPHCANGAYDPGNGETGADCGGTCGTCVPSLIMTEIAEYSTNTLVKYVELYNASGQPLNLSQFTIRSYLNGATAPTRSQVLPNFMLGKNKAYVIVKTQGNSGYQTAFGKVPDLLSTIPNGNGNDVYSIENSFGLVDIYGQIGVNGTGQPWDYAKKIAKRNVGVVAGQTVWLASEWTITAGTATANPGVRD